MKNVIYIVLFICLSCNQYDHEIDKLVFYDDAKNVTKAISRMKDLMDKLPNDDIVNYFITDKNYLYINNNKCCKFDEAILLNNESKIKELSALTKQEYKEFFLLILFLDRNYIRSSIKTHYFYKYIFLYDRFGYSSYDLQRNIILIDDYEDNIKNHYIIKDNIDSLLLLAPKSIEEIEASDASNLHK